MSTIVYNFDQTTLSNQGYLDFVSENWAEPDQDCLEAFCREFALEGLEFALDLLYLDREELFKHPFVHVHDVYEVDGSPLAQFEFADLEDRDNDWILEAFPGSSLQDLIANESFYVVMPLPVSEDFLILPLPRNLLREHKND